MRLLLIDTSTNKAGAGIWMDGRELLSKEWLSNMNHTKELMTVVQSLLHKSSITANSLTHVAVARGPGGFTSVRIGISVALGIATPYNLQVIGVRTHAIQAHPFVKQSSPDQPLYSLIPVGKNALSWERFEGSSETVSEGINSAEKLVKTVQNNATLCGEGVVELRKVGVNIRNDAFPSNAAPSRSISVMLSVVQEMLRGRSDLSNLIQPIYARPPKITAPKRTYRHNRRT